MKNLKIIDSFLLAALILASIAGCNNIAPNRKASQRKDLVDGLWNLTRQNDQITLSDLVAELNLSPDQITVETVPHVPKLMSWELTVKNWKDEKNSSALPVRIVYSTGVVDMVQFSKYPFQQVLIYLNDSARCSISTEAIHSRLGIPFETSYYPGTGDVAPMTYYSFGYSDSKTENQLSVQPKCTSIVEIKKFFLSKKQQGDRVDGASAVRRLAQ